MSPAEQKGTAQINSLARRARQTTFSWLDVMILLLLTALVTGLSLPWVFLFFNTASTREGEQKVARGNFLCNHDLWPTGKQHVKDSQPFLNAVSTLRRDKTLNPIICLHMPRRKTNFFFLTWLEWWLISPRILSTVMVPVPEKTPLMALPISGCNMRHLLPQNTLDCAVNRVGHNPSLLASQHGTCVVIGVVCCTYVPDYNASLSDIIAHIKHISEVHVNDISNRI